MEKGDLALKLAACEMMGSVTSICTSEYTLVMDRMTVVCGYIADHTFEDASEVVQMSKQLPKTVSPMIIQGMAINSTASRDLLNTESGEQNGYSGSGYECALLELLDSMDVNYETIRKYYPAIRIFPFTPERRMMATVVQCRSPPPNFRIHIKGSPEEVLSRCNYYMNRQGGVSRMTNAARDHILARLKEMAKADGGRRMLGFAQNTFNAFDPIISNTERDSDPAIWIGFVGMKAPVRPGIKQAIADCHSVNVTVRLVTGDSLDTAIKIARETGILSSTSNTHDKNSYAMIASDWRSAIHHPRYQENVYSSINPTIAQDVKDLRVLARCTADDKHKLVEVLQSKAGNEEIVAITGKHLSDVKVLELADVGFSLGLTSSTTDSAKSASHLVLIDDQLTSLVQVLKWGREIYHSTRTMLQSQLTVAITLIPIFIVSGITYLTNPLPIHAPNQDNGGDSGGTGLVWILNPVQFLWIYLITDTLASISLFPQSPLMTNSKQEEHNGTNLKYQNNDPSSLPVPRQGPLLDFPMIFKIIGHSATQFLIVIFLRFYTPTIFCMVCADPGFIQTIIFNTLVFLQMFYQFTCHSNYDYFKRTVELSRNESTMIRRKRDFAKELLKSIILAPLNNGHHNIRLYHVSGFNRCVPRFGYNVWKFYIWHYYTSSISVVLVCADWTFGLAY